jgi:hypothetical protein
MLWRSRVEKKNWKRSPSLRAERSKPDIEAIEIQGMMRCDGISGAPSSGRFA